MIEICETSAQRTRYVRADLLLPGDVFLARRNDSGSRTIARWTRGPYSHAALYHGAFCVFEAVADGIGYTGLGIVKTCPSKNDRACILLDASHYEKLEIRRHPLLEKQAESTGRYDLEDRLAELLVPENGKKYPPLQALARAVPSVPWPLVLPFLWLRERRSAIDGLAPGMFCSQLVANVLQELGAHPLRRGWFGQLPRPETLSPNHFQSRRSALCRVPNIIVDESFDCSQSEDGDLTDLRMQQIRFLQLMDKNRDLETRIALKRVDELYRRLLTPP